MTFRFGAALAKNPTAETNESPVILPTNTATEKRLAAEIGINAARMNAEDQFLQQSHTVESLEPGETVLAPDGSTQEHVNAATKLSQLIADDFPFDESQLSAIDGLVNQRFGCLTGAAGTGKTTTTKKLVQELISSESVGNVNLRGYFKKADSESSKADDDDDYEQPDPTKDSWVPSVCLVGFTGRSSQMIKKNFPRDWHPNIMTIHRMLAFVPEFYEDFDSAAGQMCRKMRFTPTYNRTMKLPWDIIIIDEAGMVSLDLWTQVWDACKQGTRIIMIGDINQLPPVHGRSIFGFAMTKWPSWELTHIHRQEGINNSIVDNAWKILKGIKPSSDNYHSDPGWKFAMMPIPEDSSLASSKIRAWLAKMNGKAYQPHRDSVITAINGEDASRGYALGQIPMNRELAIVFNRESPRYIIDAGRERKQFAVGDKVMATRNDHEVGITNGMTGIIIDIKDNGAYAGDKNRFGKVEDVQRYLMDVDDEDEADFSLADIAESYADIAKGKADAKEKKDRGPASHIVTVKFGQAEHAFDIPFGTLSEVATLMTAYVVTCHKMQGGESPLVVVICHQSHKAMLNREWLYTAVTRASQKCVLFFTDQGLRAALSKQRISGRTLQEKVKVFQDLQTKGLVGAAVNVDVPEPESYATDLAVAKPQTMVEHLQDRVESEARPTGENPALKLLGDKARKATVERTTQVHIHGDVNITVNNLNATVQSPKESKTFAELEKERLNAAEQAIFGKPIASIGHGWTPASRAVVPYGPIRTLAQTKRPEPLRLTCQPLTLKETLVESVKSESVLQKSVRVPAAAKVPTKFRFGGK